MPSTVSSSSTSAWACVQSPFASHHSAAKGGVHSLGGAASAIDDLNFSAVMVCSDLRHPTECNNKQPFSNVKWKVNGYSVILNAAQTDLEWRHVPVKLPTQKSSRPQRASCNGAARLNLHWQTSLKKPE